MKYRIQAFPPKAKRMVGSGVLQISTDYGYVKEYKLGDMEWFDFEIPDNIPWIHSNRMIDGPYFDVRIRYTNKDGTREEIIKPVPTKMSDEQEKGQ